MNSTLGRSGRYGWINLPNTNREVAVISLDASTGEPHRPEVITKRRPMLTPWDHQDHEALHVTAFNGLKPTNIRIKEVSHLRLVIGADDLDLGNHGMRAMTADISTLAAAKTELIDTET